MKVMLLNGSPHEKGCTYTALEEVQPGHFAACHRVREINDL